MAGFELNRNKDITLDHLEPSATSALFALYDDALRYYQSRLLNLSPASFSSPEEFLRKWNYYRGAIEATEDLITILKGKDK